VPWVGVPDGPGSGIETEVKREVATMDEVRAALEKARTRDHLVWLQDGTTKYGPLPAPIGVDCPEHPSFALVIKDGEPWCRRGQHVLLGCEGFE